MRTVAKYLHNFQLEVLEYWSEKEHLFCEATYSLNCRSNLLTEGVEKLNEV